jgi:hypothetical protein
VNLWLREYADGERTHTLVCVCVPGRTRTIFFPEQ